MLMAAGAAPVTMAVGAVGGTALIAAAWLRTAPRGVVVGLIAVGTVPLAALAWSAMVPLLLPSLLSWRRFLLSVRGLRLSLRVAVKFSDRVGFRAAVAAAHGRRPGDGRGAVQIGRCGRCRWSRWRMCRSWSPPVRWSAARR
jgi:hypothetical protein